MHFNSFFLTSLALTATSVLAVPAGPGGNGEERGDTRPLVSTKPLQKLINAKDLLKQAAKLQSFALSKNGANTRAFGGYGHNKTINYIYEEVKKLGKWYDVQFQPFVQSYSDSRGTLKIEGKEVPFFAARRSPETEGLTGVLGAAIGEGCNAGDFPAANQLKGKIVLLSRGNCTITLKSQLAGAAGASAVLVYNNVVGTILDGRVLDQPGLVPTGALSNELGLKLLARVNKGEKINAKLSINTIVEERRTYNVIAQTKSGDPNNVLFVGGHSDSVPIGPGINDNGSGSIGLLEVLIKLKNFKLKNAIRFGWWSAEEFGLLGAAYYVSQLTPEENLKIRGYLNFDMIGSPNYILGVYDGSGKAFNLTGPAGSDLFQYTFEDYFTRAKRGSVPTAFTGRSDYGPFLEVNIPSGGLFTGAEGIKTKEEKRLFGGSEGRPYDENYHQPGDLIGNLNVDALVENTKAIADSVAKYGASFKGFPARTLLNKRDVDWSEGTHGHGHNHFEGGAGGCGDGLY